MMRTYIFWQVRLLALMVFSGKRRWFEKVTYKGCKSPKSWRGSYAEQLVDLDQVSEATVFFRGTAREAALKFPANANVAATIALAGLGMDETMVELTVDPKSIKNTPLWQKVCSVK
jgi:aspartate dehydrogenase